MVVWSHDLYSIPVDKLLEMRAETTIVGGKIVYEASAATSGTTMRTVNPPSSGLNENMPLMIPLALAVVVAAVAAVVLLRRKKLVLSSRELDWRCELCCLDGVLMDIVLPVLFV